jgi:hypothetical protein
MGNVSFRLYAQPCQIVMGAVDEMRLKELPEIDMLCSGIKTVTNKHAQKTVWTTFTVVGRGLSLLVPR